MTLSDLVINLQALVASELSTPLDIVAVVAGVAAGGMIVVSSFLRTMIPLRWMAVGSNVGFVVYGALHPSMPMLMLHSVLLPINIYRAREMGRLSRRVRAAARAADLSGIWLKPYMRSRQYRAGTTLFRKGDRADQLYFLAEGRIEFVEIGSIMEPGRIFGEVALFSPERRRTLTARCVEKCKVLSIDEASVEQLYFQNPAFGFKLIALVAGRLSADVRRLEDRLANAASA